MFVDYPKYEATEGSPPDVPLYSMQSGIGIYDHIWSYNNIYAFISVLLNAECAKFIQIGTSHLDTPQRWHDGLCLCPGNKHNSDVVLLKWYFEWWCKPCVNHSPKSQWQGGRQQFFSHPKIEKIESNSKWFQTFNIRQLNAQSWHLLW
jgi:hypothetical protein